MILTYKYRLKDKRAARELRRYAVACNQVWNYCNAVQRDVESRYRAGAPKRRWPSHFALTYLTVRKDAQEYRYEGDFLKDVARIIAPEISE